MKFRKNPSSGSRVVPCGRIDRRTDMTKVIVAFRNFANELMKQPAIISRGKQTRSLLFSDSSNSEGASLVQCDAVMRDNMETVLRFSFEAHIKYGIQFRIVETNL